MRYLLAYVAISISGMIAVHGVTAPKSSSLSLANGAVVAAVVCESVVTAMEAKGKGWQVLFENVNK